MADNREDDSVYYDPATGLPVGGPEANQPRMARTVMSGYVPDVPPPLPKGDTGTITDRKSTRLNSSH